MTHFEFASAVGAVYDRALFFSSITSSGRYEKSCAVIDRAYSRREFKVSHYLAEFELSPWDLPLYPARGSSEMALKKSWTGLLYEDFEVGDVYEHPLGRTVLSADNTWFTLLTMNTQPLHFDHHYASKTGFGKPLVNSCLTLSIVTGQSVMDLSQNVFANLGWDEVRLPNPVYEGDTIYARSEILETRESRSRANVGIVQVRTTGLNQDGTVVIEFKRSFMVYKRGHAPKSS